MCIIKPLSAVFVKNKEIIDDFLCLCRVVSLGGLYVVTCSRYSVPVAVIINFLKIDIVIG